MTSDLIQQLQSILDDLIAGDDTARDRLIALVGDPVTGDKVAGDKIEVGTISGSQAVAVGSNIRIAITQQGLPPDVIDTLRRWAEVFDRQAKETLQAKGHIRVFLSSPGDVLDERKLAMKAIRQLQNDPLYKNKITIEAVAWDNPDDSTPLLASIDPQTAINNGMARPSKCDIVVVIFWARMGTPLDHSRYQKADGSQYLSGTEWEFEEALTGTQEKGRPLLVVYRRTETPKVDLDDDDLEEKIRQRKRVQAFFDSFVNPDGSLRQGYNAYKTPSEFGDVFVLHLRKLVARLIEEDQPRTHNREVDIDQVNIVPPITWPAGVSPFPGLRAFTADDAPVYFGRGRETDALIKRLGSADSRFVAVLGASGSGKSSLVRAGVIPRLADGALTGSADWPVVIFTPDEWAQGDPFDSLAGALIAGPLSLPPRGLAQGIRGSHTALRQLLEETLEKRKSWSQMLLVIDQFEELFTRVDDTDLRRAFVQTLAELTRSDRLRVIVTMRADFSHRCAELPELAALLESSKNSTFWLSAPGQVSLYEMITGPAAAAGLEFDDGLAQQILDDTGDDPGALALMAYALEQLYDTSHANGRLTWEAYRSFGGVQGAIGERAHDTFTQLDEAAQDALPRVFRELVEVDERGTATRKRAPVSVVAPDDPSWRLVDALVRARLLSASGEDGGSAIVEVAHEALFRSWPTLADWIREAQDDLILLRQVRAAAREWDDKGQQRAFRWPDERLQPVYEMQDRLKPKLNDIEREFIRSEFEILTEEIHDPETTQQRRSAIGERLAAIGDRRPGVGLVCGILPLEISGGDAPMLGGQGAPAGTPPSGVRLWGDKPEHEGLPDIVFLPVKGVKQYQLITDDGDKGTYDIADFYIAQYLVTYEQFSAFLEADDGWNHPEKAWWKDLAANDNQKDEPGTQRAKFANYPRDTVSWYDAVAFCRWLSARTGVEVRLPAEWEWQWAAASDTGWAYPYGPEFNAAVCNTTEGGPGRTTAVGMYPLGAAACGALDMSGNVYEWCLNEYDNPAEVGMTSSNTRVLRGGACFSNAHWARAVYRSLSDYFPLDRNDSYGFRVVGVSVPVLK